MSSSVLMRPSFFARFTNLVTRWQLQQQQQCSRSLSTQTSASTIIDASIGLTSAEKALQETALNFAINEFRPHMREWDEKGYFPRKELRQAATLGFGGLYATVDDGGAGLSRLETTLVVEALAQGCVSTAAFLAIHNMCVSMLCKFGSAELKSKLLGGLISFDLMASHCITEPGAGSDVANLTTTAVKRDGYYILNGTKTLITGGGENDVYFVMCRTGSPGSRGISCILVEKGSPGLHFGKKEVKLGWRTHPTSSVIMEDCRVPEENLLGVENGGFAIAMDGINGGRLNISSCSLGAAQRAMEETILYCSERKQFRQPLISFQNTQFKLATFAADLLASRLMVRTAARRLDEELNNSNTGDSAEDNDNTINNRHIPLPALSAAAKYTATERCFQIADGCLQMLGGYGYLNEFPLQQLMRDSRVHRIIAGTNEVMQMVIARDFTGKK